MNEQTELFVSDVLPPYQVFWKTPLARHSDPVTSHEAAATVKPGNSDLIHMIRGIVSIAAEPVSAFQIAAALRTNARWSESTVRTAVSRAGLHAVDTLGTTPRGRRCLRYVLGSA